MIIGTILFFSLSNYAIPNAHTDDMMIKEECTVIGWQATITDTDGNPLTNAKWWSEGNMNDDDFVSGIKFLVKERIMQIPQTTKAPLSTGSEDIPSWIKNNADWWSQGLISDDDFLKEIQFMVENGIIVI